VVSGPFINLEGEAVHQDGRCRVQLRVSLLGQAVPMDIPIEQIEAV